MPVNLSIKQVPDDIVGALRERARRHHRSLQGELVSILEEAVRPRHLTVDELRRRGLERGLQTGDESATFTRQDRDAR